MRDHTINRSGIESPRTGSRIPRSVTLPLAALMLLSTPDGGEAQEDSVTASAGARYQLSPEFQPVLGADYRDLWTAPIRVPILRPDTFAGGLTLLQRGGGAQTASLRFGAPSGAEYVFRSVDKNQEGGLPPDLRNTLTSRIIQDQVSSKHPGAALVVAGIQEAAGVLHPSPRLAVLADDPLLGEHREEFAGMLGMLEERPEESEEGYGFAGFPRVIGSERLLERLEESPEDRADARAYLRARLVDLLVGDWDRHPDQWRWGQDDRNGVRYWIAIPRDRDNAFSSYDGVAGRVGGALRPNVQSFGPRYDNLYGMIHNAQELDRRILPALSREVWDSTAVALRERISDEVITAAIRRMPPPYVEMSGEALKWALLARRDQLPQVAREFYSLLFTEVDVRGTDADDRAEITRNVDGSVRVRLLPPADDAPFFDRTFSSEETREVRVYLHGGADRAVVLGEGGGITIRVIGGGGDDALQDRSVPRGGALTAFYDHRGDNRILRQPRTVVDRRDFDVPEVSSAAENNAPPPRDWGSGQTMFRPRAEWWPGVGPVVGGGPARTRYGFRRVPFASERRADLLVAPLHGRGAVEAGLHRVHTGGGGATELEVRASQLHLTHFHGFGNETTRRDSERSRVWSTELTASALLSRDLPNGVRISAGPLLRHLRPSAPELRGAEIAGSAPFWHAGLTATALLERVLTPGTRRMGLRLRATAEGAPLVAGDLAEPFYRVEAVGTGEIPFGGRLEPTLAVRLGGAATSADAPLQYAAFLGGGGSLRGHDTQRFAGAASAAGSVELRTTLTRANLLLARGELGSIAFLDAGRIFHRGESSNQVHTGYGGGVWFGTLNRTLVVHALVGFGETTTLHAGFGFPF